MDRVGAAAAGAFEPTLGGMTREQASALLREWTSSESLLAHARAVEEVLRALARREGADEDLWGNAGLLHDADYERFPDRHPEVTVERLRALGEHELAQAVSAHYTKWGVPCSSRLDQALLAADELTGFVVACSLVHPDGIAGLTPAFVMKKLRQKGFAAKVDREEIRLGSAAFGVETADLVAFVIGVLHARKLELGLR